MSQKWRVLFYISESKDNPVQTFLEGLEEREHAKLLRIIQYIQEYGLIAVLPHVKRLTGVPIWEIRVLGRDSLRVLYVVPFKETVLLLHGFRKKTQKTPEKEVTVALRRYQDWKKRNQAGS